MHPTKHPILFSTEMVRAILDGQKTVTRRTSGLKEINEAPDAWELFRPEWNDEGMVRIGNSNRGKLLQLKSPYGKPGDILWVRETWARVVNVNNDEHFSEDRPFTDPEYREVPPIMWSCYWYRADGETEWCDADGFSTERSWWRPSIHMPFAACRLFLMVKSVRIERLHDITEDDAMREGVFARYEKDEDGLSHKIQSAVDVFSELWESINGPDSWLQNPWVWRIEFERIEKEYALNLLNQ